MRLGSSLTPLIFTAAANQQQVFRNLEPAAVSLVDNLYGDIVHDETSLNHRQFLIDSGSISLNILDNKESDYNEKSFNYYLQMRSQLNLPDKDDTSDIQSDQNMFGGILTYAHFPHFNCFNPDLYHDKEIDIAIVGAPFDTGVSYRPGARFGPEAIRSSARRLGGLPIEKKCKGKKYPRDPYDLTTHDFKIVDCGDVAMTPFDNRIALNQLYRGLRAIHKHNTKREYPKIITMGGDHTITLMALKSIRERVGVPVKVIHFDSHIDTWDPTVLGGGITNYMKLNHGTFLHYAHELGYINNTGNYHVGIRAPLIDSVYDTEHDSECGFTIIRADDIDKVGVKGIINTLKNAFGSGDPVYISVDIDVLDPATAPGTGTMEIGGFTGRELLSILRGLKGINLVGADVVEVSPPYDTNSEITSLAATSVIDSFLELMINETTK
ncbi:hypothetical protein JA1_000651 [Spathaspora sp. JA1]|nr:hypothetical protein JA1_000651 [Spathaspora sp. JA1]